MAEQNDLSAIEPQGDASTPLRRDRTRRAPERRATAASGKVARTAAATKAPRPASKGPRTTAKPLRSLVILAMVGGLVATVGLPAYAASSRMAPTDEAQTLQQAALDDAQSMVVADDAVSVELARDSYAATTAEEIAQAKAAEAAAARARVIAAAAANKSVLTNVDLSMVAPGSGEVRWPLTPGTFTKGRGLGDSGYHQGVDLLAPARTPIFAAAAGVVRVSQESYGGYGVAVTIDHVVAGQTVSTLYGHMTYGSRVVVSGQTVEAGQLIGLVGSTGSSTANHLHFETRVNGALVDPWAWLVQNAG